MSPIESVLFLVLVTAIFLVVLGVIDALNEIYRNGDDK